MKSVGFNEGFFANEKLASLVDDSSNFDHISYFVRSFVILA